MSFNIMSFKKTVITHIYNEEYLLPFWLNHHKNIFDHGIIIDYRSTDNSVKICKEICPSWHIITTRNNDFNSFLVDKEVMDIENLIEGYKIVLNTTEFLFSSKPLNEFCIDSLISYGINVLTPYSLNIYDPDSNISLYNLLLDTDTKYHLDRYGTRQLHNFKNGNYDVGRHITYNPMIYTNDIYIIWLGFFPLNQKLLNRKLQIKNNIPESDKQIGNGAQHLYDVEKMLSINTEKSNTGLQLKEINENLYQLIESYVIS